ncbi:MAG: tetratricopeptide repeat protein [Treponema sp.]|jgi:tetratricopeptide (TPR) repeat protein|nr:tetratricopeptide repeat protein [Treponema sp.]
MAEKGEAKKQGTIRRDNQDRDIPARKGLREGKRLFNLSRWDMALRELLGVKPVDFTAEESIDLAYFIGLSYTKLGRYEDSLLYLEQVIAGSKDFLRNAQCRMTLAYIYVITNREKLAEFELGQLLKNGYESVQIYTTLAYAAWVQKRNKQAIAYYEKALEIDRNNTTALNGLGFILADANIDPIRALRLCKRAVEMKPQNPAYLDSLGWAYFQYGDIAEARAWMRKAVELSPKNEDIRVHLKIISGKEL